MTSPRSNRAFAGPAVGFDPSGRRRRRVDGVSLLTVYLVLLFAIPSNLTITAMGSLGRPSLIWGLVLIVFWAIARLQLRNSAVRAPHPSVAFAFSLFLVIALIGFAAALLRGQPDDQVSPAFTAIVRLLSWGGVVLVAVDGVRTAEDVFRMARRLVIATGLIAALGIAQFLTGQTLLDFFNIIPGVSNSGGGVLERGGVTRSSGTAIHPLEFATTLIGVLPLAISAAISGAFHRDVRGTRFLWWIPVVLIAVSAIVGVSRSAIIGFLLAAVLMIPAIPRRFRAVVITAGVLLSLGVLALLPGLLGTTLGLFAGAATDPSAQSRVGGLDKAPGFIGSSPLFGAGWGTFLPRYYIFDNEWVLITIEMGVLGVAAFAWLLLSSVWSAFAARRRARNADVSLIGYALAVAVVVIGVMFAFFDGLSFPISAGTLFLVIGLCGSLRHIGRSESFDAAPPRR
jgi:hypothetical protein